MIIICRQSLRVRSWETSTDAKKLSADDSAAVKVVRGVKTFLYFSRKKAGAIFIVMILVGSFFHRIFAYTAGFLVLECSCADKIHFQILAQFVKLFCHIYMFIGERR